MEFLETILTALLSVAALFIITKIMGHKQVAQLDFFDYVCSITIGSIGAELATEPEEPEKPCRPHPHRRYSLAWAVREAYE